MDVDVHPAAVAASPAAPAATCARSAWPPAAYRGQSYWRAVAASGQPVSRRYWALRSTPRRRSMRSITPWSERRSVGHVALERAETVDRRRRVRRRRGSAGWRAGRRTPRARAPIRCLAPAPSAGEGGSPPGSARGPVSARICGSARIRSSIDSPRSRRPISASRMSMRACVSRRTYDTSVSSSRHSACMSRRSSIETSRRGRRSTLGSMHPCAVRTCSLAHPAFLLRPRYQRRRVASQGRRSSAQQPADLSVGYGSMRDRRCRRRSGSRSGGADRWRCRSSR